jgi:hypothetical protein
MTGMPETRYAKSGELHIAYQVMGAGPLDLVFVPGFVSGGSGCLNRISASLSGLPPGVGRSAGQLKLTQRCARLCCHAEGQRVVVGLIGGAPVKR